MASSNLSGVETPQIALVPYRDPSIKIDERVEDLLLRMTTAEKVGQLLQLNAQDDLEDIVVTRHAGSILHASPKRLIDAMALAAQSLIESARASIEHLSPCGPTLSAEPEPVECRHRSWARVRGCLVAS